jgi:hypothetical protein
VEIYLSLKFSGVTLIILYERFVSGIFNKINSSLVCLND